MDRDPAVIKLPLFSKTSKLAAIPGQSEGVTYGVVWDACRDPEHGFGYVAELLPGRRARLLAWLAADGKAYSCDRPLTGLAGLRPSLELAQWQDRKGQGAIRVPDPNGGGQPVIVGEYQDMGQAIRGVIRGDATGNCLPAVSRQTRHGGGASGRSSSTCWTVRCPMHSTR